MKTAHIKLLASHYAYQMSADEADAVLSAIYTQIEELKTTLRTAVGGYEFEVKQELKFLRSAERKLKRRGKISG